MNAISFRTRLRKRSTVMRIGNGMEGKRKGMERFRYVVGGWSLAKKSSNATACIGGRELREADEKHSAMGGGVR